VRKADNLTAICDAVIWKVWEPQRLTTLWASTACYKDRFAFFYIYNVAKLITVQIYHIFRISFGLQKLRWKEQPALPEEQNRSKGPNLDAADDDDDSDATVADDFPYSEKSPCISLARVRFLAVLDYSLLHSIQTDCEVHPASYPLE
jgi:hypothetical protein